MARRPLRVEELAEVLAFDLAAGGISKLNAIWRWEDKEEAVLSACSSLVSVIIDDGSRVVQFSHFSVKEFLTSNRLASCMKEVSQFYIPIEPSHAILAQACLGVLLFLDDRADEDSVKKIPLYQYATEYWVEHSQVGNVELQIKDAVDYFFDMDNPHFSAWVRLEHPGEFLRVSMNEGPTGIPRSAAPLYFAAWKGLHGLVERLIIKYPEQVNHLGGLHGTPLHASVLGGHLKASRLLFAHGADINSRCADNYTPLHVASGEGHLRIGKWLLDHGADVNSKEKRGWTPLHFAAKNGHLEACRMLLERNAEVNSRNDEGLTPLHKASMGFGKGSAVVVGLLLDYGADVQVRNLSGKSPSEVARGPEQQEIVRLLSQHAAE